MTGERKPFVAFIVDPVEVDCVGCGRKVTAGYDRESGDPVMLHVKPECQRFDAIDTVDDGASFLEACRLLILQQVKGLKDAAHFGSN